MQGLDANVVVVVPWYERSDFEQIRLLGEGSALPANYDAWLESAFRNMRQLLAKGCPLKIVTVHVEDYLNWLATVSEDDSIETRSRYVTMLAESGSQLPGSRFCTGKSWPGFPTEH